MQIDRAAGESHVAALEALARAAAAARHCYGRSADARSAELATWETYALLELQRNATAEAVLDTFFLQYAGAATPVLTAYMHSLRGGLRVMFGRLLEGLEDYRAGLAVSPDDDILGAVELHLNAALTYQRLGDDEKARRELEIASRRLLDLPEKDPWRTFLFARTLSQRADLDIQHAARTGHFDPDTLAEAEAYASRAATLYEGSGIHAEAARALTQVADARALRGAIEEAVSIAERALASALLSKDAHAILLARYKTGRLRAFQQQASGPAVEQLAQVYADARDMRRLDIARRTAATLGSFFEAAADLNEAERWLRRAIEDTERYRSTLGTSNWSAVAFEEWQQPYRALVRVLIKQNRLDEAFTVLDEVRARRLTDLRRQARRYGTLSARQRAASDSLAGVLAAIRAELQQEHRPARRSALEAEEIRVTRAYDTVFGELDAPLPLSLRALHRVLAHDQRVLLAYFIDTPVRLFDIPAESFLFIVTADTLIGRTLNIDRNNLQAQLADVSPLLTAAQPLATVSSMRFDLRALRRLHRLLIGPAARLIPQNAAVTIIPDGPLYGLPFSALVTNEVARYDYETARFFVEQHPISTELAASLLLEKSEVPAELQKALIMGRSRFDGRSMLLGQRDAEGPSALPDLPGIAQEVEKVCSLIEGETCVHDQPAMEQMLYKGLANAGVVHLASHTVASPRAPLSSAFILSPSADSADDGILHAYELIRNHEALRLVVLNGCNTARGQIHAGEGMVGLQYAFRAMGTASVASMRWYVDDSAARHLMEAFYEYLLAGHSLDAALRSAQLDLLQRGGPRRNPFFWAAPVLYGRLDPVPLRSAAIWPLWAWMLMMLGIIAAGLVLYRHMKPSVSSADSKRSDHVKRHLV